MPVHAALLAELYLPEICQGPIRDCGRMPTNPEVIHLGGKNSLGLGPEEGVIRYQAFSGLNQRNARTMQAMTT